MTTHVYLKYAIALLMEEYHIQGNKRGIDKRT